MVNFIISFLHYNPIQLFTRIKLLVFGRKKINFSSNIHFNKLNSKSVINTVIQSKDNNYALNSLKALEDDSIIYLNNFNASSINFFENDIFDENDSLKKYELCYLNCFSDIVFSDDKVFKGKILKTLNNIYRDSHSKKFHHSFWYPYSVSSRIINISIVILSLESSNQVSDDIYILYSNLFNDYTYLKRNIEFDSDGNHLLKNYISLCIGSIFFQSDQTLSYYDKLNQLLSNQILKSGFHYEKSFDYHNSLLYDLSILNDLLGDNHFDNSKLSEYLIKMLSFSNRLKRNEKILFNDSFRNYHFNENNMTSYLSSKYTLNDETSIYPFKALRTSNFEILAYLSDINPKHCPAHLHDAIGTYELWFNSQKFITDSGNSDYNNSQNRLYFRSSNAHNISTISNNGQSFLYKPFRFGRIAKLNELIDQDNSIEICFSEIEGIFYSNRIKRKIQSCTGLIEIEDTTNKNNSFSYIHIHPDVNIERISSQKYILSKNKNVIVLQIENSTLIDSYIDSTPFSEEFYRIENKKTINIKFNNQLRYTYISQSNNDETATTQF